MANLEFSEKQKEILLNRLQMQKENFDIIIQNLVENQAINYLLINAFLGKLDS